uniref:Kinesin motor domain-containing protein n=1 Tax=Periophthalmus magnuspinnatus TaxID=409849 RepID=A0A3B3ZCG4_9GOBI
MGSHCVKVMVRVCPVSQSDESSSFLKVNPSKKQITIMDPAANQTANTASQKRPSANQVPPKMFTFDAAFPPDASQAEVCAGTVAEVIQSVVNGADGCVFCFGHSKLGKSHTMIGRDDSLQTLGIIPCAISWLFKLINERKEKTGARFSVRVSAVEVWGKEENLKDLLSEVATGSLQDGQSPGVYLCEDPICGMQLQNQSELRAPTPEKAAWFLDAALAARHSSQRPDTSEEEQRNSHMLFTLHIYQYRMEKTGKGGMSGGRSRLHLLDLGSCDNMASTAPLCLSLSALGNVILALVNGSKHIPYKDSKLTMLLRESLGNMNCRTTMIAHISASPRDFSETLSTIQIASRVLRMKKKKTKYTSSSSGGESSCEEGRMRRPTHLRAFHHRGDTDSDLPLLRLSSDQDEYSSSEQSCDTVIYVGPNGAAVSDRELTDNEGPPEFVPIIPALLRVWPVAAGSCLKCNTFAELQERLDCIDGSEEVKAHLLLLTNDQQLQDIKEVVEEAELAQTMIHNLTQRSGSPIVTCTRSVPGSSSSSTSNPFRENLNGGSNGEGKTRTLGSPRLGIASLTKTAEYRPPASPSQRCKVYTQKCVMPTTPPLSSNTLAQDYSGRSSTDSVLSRTSPVGMSPQVKETAPSLSASLGSAETLCDDDVPPIPLDMQKDGSYYSKCSFYSQAVYISFVRFLLCKTLLFLLLQVAMAKLRVEGEALATVLSSCASPMSSWMSDLSMCSEADQSLHSFSQSQSQQGEAMAETEQNVTLGSDELEQTENESNKQTPTKNKLRKLPPPMTKTTIQTLVGPFKATISVHPCVAVKPMVIKEPSVLSSPVKGSLIKEPIKCSTPLSGCVSSEMSFEDPWLKRGFEEGTSTDLVCEVKPEKREHSQNTFGSDVVLSPDSIKRVGDGCEIMAVVAQGDCLTTIYNPDIHQTASLPRGWHRINRHDGLDYTEYRNLSVTSSTPCSPRATLDRRGSNGKIGFFSQKRGGIPPLPPVRKSSLDQRNRAASPLHQPGTALQDEACISAGVTRQRGASIDSSRLFSAKLEQLATRTNSLGRTGSHSGTYHYECFSLERGESLRAGARGDSVMPRTGRSLMRTGSLSSTGTTSPSFTPLLGPSSAPQSPAKTSSQSKISAVSKLLMTSPKGRSLSASSTKTLSFSTKSLSTSSSRSSSLPPNGKGPTLGSWTTQSLSRSRGGGLAAKLPLRAVNGRISELLQGSAGSRASVTTVSSGPGEERPSGVQTLPSPYSKITAPRKPHRCSSGHASDNSSVLSGELPPAMGKTALFYHSGGSSGYESMLRDSSENTGSASSAQDSLSDHSTATSSSRRSSKSSKKCRSNTGLQRRRLIPALTLDSASLSPSHRSSNPGACWVDGPLGPPASTNHRVPSATAETFEIKVYEIDDVERLQKRRDRGGSKEVVYVSAKLKKLENRQQRISEVRAKYQCLKKELEQTKQHLMLEPHKWTTEFELQQVYEVDSLEYLQALEIVTDRLETRVNFCKAHLMMITCFDVSSKHR